MAETEPTGSLQWLRDANTGWREYGEAQRDRADHAELLADREHWARLRAQRSAARWHATAVNGYAWFVAMCAQVAWHWPFWTAIPILVGAVILDFSLTRCLRGRARRKAEADG